MADQQHVKCIIVGGGPAGLTAGIYAARAGLHPLVFTGIDHTSQMTSTSIVENYSGAPKIDGSHLIEVQSQQAEDAGAELMYEDVTKIDVSCRPFKITHGIENEVLLTDSLIFATGSRAQRLEVKGEKKFWQKGVSACAICDGKMAEGGNAVVVGGGDVACEEALYLSKIANKVFIVLRRDVFRASQVMADRIAKNNKIEIIFNSNIDEICGNEKVDCVKIKNGKTGEIKSVEAKALFWCVGHVPETQLLENQVELTKTGYIITKGQSSYTSVDGVFACGDCMDFTYRQAIVAAGSGAKAALDCERWLMSQGK